MRRHGGGRALFLFFLKKIIDFDLSESLSCYACITVWAYATEQRNLDLKSSY